MKRLRFYNLKSVNNPSSIHGIYPYRGKISAIDAQQVIRQFRKGAILLDPFCGSGTIVYEAQKSGLKAYGVDLNPIAVDIAKAKLSISNKKYEDFHKEAISLVNNAKTLQKDKNMDSRASKHFHKETAHQIMRLSYYFDEMSEYIKACFYGAICLSARGCNWYKWTSSTVGKDINPKRNIDFYAKFIEKTKKHFYPNKYNNSRVFLYDARKLSDILKPDSVDYVFTSPPYFDCLDYTAYYAKIIYYILGKDRSLVRKDLIQNYTTYENDMKEVLAELEIVCKKGATIIFVVGDKKIHGRVINGGMFFKDISPFKSTDIVEREYKGTSSQIFDSLNRTKRKEQIVVWSK